jgi:hypothetical protein
LSFSHGFRHEVIFTIWVRRATRILQVRHSSINQHHGSGLMSLPCSIHVRIYNGQFARLIPRALQAARNLIASRSTNSTSVKSSITSVGFASASRSSCNSGTCLSSIRPLIAKIACPSFSDLRIFNIAPTVGQFSGHTQCIDKARLRSVTSSRCSGITNELRDTERRDYLSEDVLSPSNTVLTFKGQST